jgi:tuftelin-interacting protein 11
VLNLDGEIAGLRKKRPVLNPSLINKGMGSWEKHTRGIGAKLLLQVFSRTAHEVDYVPN